MKKILSILAMAALLTVSAEAQFRPGGSAVQTVNSSVITLTTTSTTNLPASAYIGNTGFTVTAYFAGTNSGSANLAVFAYPVGNGITANSTSTYLGSIAMNGTTGVRNSLFVPATTFPGCPAVQLSLTNAHTASLFITNVTVSAW